jgi:hypothetical protein
MASLLLWQLWPQTGPAPPLVTALELLQGRRKAVTVDQISKFDGDKGMTKFLMARMGWL